jgi:lipopolysaccharide export system protein LptA
MAHPDRSADMPGPLLMMLVLLACWLSVPSGTAEAQSRVRILQSDQLEGIVAQEGRIRKLTGNVALRTEDFTIVCDSAWHYLDLEELRAWGNIQITSERDEIWSDKATYDLVSEVALFEGRVVMQSERALLFSEEVFYSFATEIALFPERMRLEDDRGVLVADSGYYYNALDSAVFRGNVQVADSLQYFEADSLFTKRVDEYYELHGRVFLDDRENRTRLTGGFVLSDSTGYRRVEGGSRMRRISEDLSDTTFLWADWLEVHQKDTINTFTAYEAVHIWTESYSSLSDTAHYDDAVERFILEGDPRLWYEEMQLTGPYILIQLEEDSVRYLESHRNSFAVQRDTSINRLNQITGDTLFIRFDEGTVSYMQVYPRGNVLYFVKDSDGQADGAIEITAEFIKLVFEDGELEDVIARRNVDGTFIQEKPGISERRLNRFVWEPEKRPQRPEDPIEPRLPPVPEERPFERPERLKKDRPALQ